MPSNSTQQQPSMTGSLEVQQHGGGVLQRLLPQIAEPGHGGAIYDPVVRRPAHVHHQRFHEIVLFIESRQFLNLSHRANGDLDASDATLRRSQDLGFEPTALQLCNTLAVKTRLIT